MDFFIFGLHQFHIFIEVIIQTLEGFVKWLKSVCDCNSFQEPMDQKPSAKGNAHSIKPEANKSSKRAKESKKVKKSLKSSVKKTVVQTAKTKKAGKMAKKSKQNAKFTSKPLVDKVVANSNKAENSEKKPEVSEQIELPSVKPNTESLPSVEIPKRSKVVADKSSKEPLVKLMKDSEITSEQVEEIKDSSANHSDEPAEIFGGLYFNLHQEHVEVASMKVKDDIVNMQVGNDKTPSSANESVMSDLKEDNAAQQTTEKVPEEGSNNGTEMTKVTDADTQEHGHQLLDNPVKGYLEDLYNVKKDD